MASPEKPADFENVPEAIADSETRGIPVVWLLPLVALLVGGWLLFKTLSEKGPEVVISFETAEGIEEGKTNIKFRDVTVGQVDTVVFSEDLAKVLVTVGMAPGTRQYLTDKTRFWVVRPRIGAGGVTGLSTLVSGAYIAMDPDNTGKSRRHFTGLEKPPVVALGKEGTFYRLRTEKLGSLSIGSPVYFRQFDVGEVTEYKLSPDHTQVDVGIFVQSPHDQFIQTGTRFWNVGGIRLSMDTSGFNLEMESLVALVNGGIAYETLPDFADTPRAEENALFTLHSSHKKSLEQPITDVATYVLRFSESVRGLGVGAPVEYRGIRIGTVVDIAIGADPRHEGVVSPVVLINMEPERTADIHEIDKAEAVSHAEAEESPEERIRLLVEKGLRARLQTGSLLTGQMFVEIDIFPEAEPATLITGGEYPEIPTVPNPLQGILANVNRILDKLEKSELDKTVVSLNELMVSTNSLVSTLDKHTPELAVELRATIQQLKTTLGDASATLASLDAMASPDGEIGNELKNALTGISEAARSIRLMADYLERHPEALLKGKAGSP